MVMEQRKILLVSVAHKYFCSLQMRVIINFEWADCSLVSYFPFILKNCNKELVLQKYYVNIGAK